MVQQDGCFGCIESTVVYLSVPFGVRCQASFNGVAPMHNTPRSLALAPSASFSFCRHVVWGTHQHADYVHIKLIHCWPVWLGGVAMWAGTTRRRCPGARSMSQHAVCVRLHHSPAVVRALHSLAVIPFGACVALHIKQWTGCAPLGASAGCLSKAVSKAVCMSLDAASSGCSRAQEGSSDPQCPLAPCASSWCRSVWAEVVLLSRWECAGAMQGRSSTPSPVLYSGF